MQQQRRRRVAVSPYHSSVRYTHDGESDMVQAARNRVRAIVWRVHHPPPPRDDDLTRPRGASKRTQTSASVPGRETYPSALVLPQPRALRATTARARACNNSVCAAITSNREQTGRSFQSTARVAAGRDRAPAIGFTVCQPPCTLHASAGTASQVPVMPAVHEPASGIDVCDRIVQVTGRDRPSGHALGGFRLGY